MSESRKHTLDVGRTQLRRLGTLTDCVYALALVLIIQWLPMPSESSVTDGRVLLLDLFTEYSGNLISIGIALAFVIVYWLRSNARTALLERTDTVHTSLSITSVFFLLFLLYIVRIGAEVAGVSSRAGESIAVALIGLPLAAGWWHAERRGLIRKGVTDNEKIGEFVVVLPSRRLAPNSCLCRLAPFAAGRVGVVAPVAHRLLGRLGDAVDDSGQELEDIPARLGWKRAAVAPGEEIGNDRRGDQLLVQQPPQHIGTEKPLNVPGVEPGKRPEGAVGSEAPVGDEHVDVWVEIEQLARGLDKPNGPWDHGAPSK